MSDILCQITWTEQDLTDAFRSEHHREPTETELAECARNLSVLQLQDRSVEFGWDFIRQAVRESESERTI